MLRLATDGIAVAKYAHESIANAIAEAERVTGLALQKANEFFQSFIGLSSFLCVIAE